MRSKKTVSPKKTGSTVKAMRSANPSSSAAYGDKTPICVNAECVMRKKAKCYGFEGCPGFKSR